MIQSSPAHYLCTRCNERWPWDGPPLNQFRVVCIHCGTQLEYVAVHRYSRFLETVSIAGDFNQLSPEEFLQDVASKCAKGKPRQYRKFLGVLRYWYLTEEKTTQLQVAKTMGVSDSLVLSYRDLLDMKISSLLVFKSLDEAEKYQSSLLSAVVAELEQSSSHA